MTEPVEYTDARNSLVTFRKKIFVEQVSGRVKALLDANHETLEKYSNVINSLSVVPYMFSNVKQKALALKLSGKDVGVGEVRQAKLSYNIGKGSYPITAPFNVAQRLLPEVDQFVYTPPTDLGLIEKSNEQMWSNLFVLQCNRNTFIEQADVSNVKYDYYKLRPVGRCKFDVPLLSGKPEFTNWDELSGEATILVRELTKVGETVKKTYDFYVLIDGNYHGVDNTMGVLPLVVIVTSETALNSNIVLNAGGKRVETVDKGVFCCFSTEAKELGWAKTHDNYGTITKVVVWANPVKLIIAVNDVVMGTTSPAPAEYDKLSIDEVLVTALPNSGYAVKNWELDGTQYPSADTFLVKCYSDHTLICMFIAGGTLTVRPNANGDKIELLSKSGNPNWQDVDEEISDGDNTYVWTGLVVRRAVDLYNFPSPSIPSGNIIDNVTVFARMRTDGMVDYARANLLLKTHGIECNDIDKYPPNGYTLYSKVYDKNPYTNNAWTIDEVNALQVGVRLETVKSPWNTPCYTFATQVWFEVTHHAP